MARQRICLRVTDLLHRCRAQSQLSSLFSHQTTNLSKVLNPQLETHLVEGKRKTYNSSILRKIDPILIPEGTLLSGNSFLNQRHEDLTDIGDVDVAPGAKTPPNLVSGFVLEGNACEFGDLHTSLLDGPSAAAVDDGGIDDGCLW